MLQMLQSFFTDYGGYVLEIIFAVGLFCLNFDRKQQFALRVAYITGLLMLFVTAYGYFTAMLPHASAYRAALNMIRYICAYVIGFNGVMFCFDTQYSSAMFSMVCGFATQHLTFRIYSSILALLGMNYSSPNTWLVILLTSAVLYSMVYVIFVKRIRQHGEQYFNNNMNLVMGAILVLFTIFIHFLLEDYINIESNPIVYTLVAGYDIICCFMTLMIEHGLFRNRVLANDKELLEHLLHQQKEQFRISKDTIDMINIKCHDMKHQISKLTAANNQDVVQELEQIITIYDSNLKTGNEILDTCLMEKQLQCERNHIKFDCIANGACLDFMVPSDIFALFGNALENAIEASCNISNEENRIISLNVTTQLGMVVIHIENNYEGQLVFNNGLPSTTKGDHNYHGFGVRSIQMIAEKYKGNVAVLAKDGIFNLNITLPEQ